jgi:arylsulfatase A-like enzyme
VLRAADTVAAAGAPRPFRITRKATCSMNPARPNVLVFFTDQQRHDTTGVHGCPLDLTPNFDRMATQSTHVAHSFTCQPVCGPARSCLQTGLYATQTGCWRNSIPLAPEHRTLAHYFRDAGYHTGYIGKWHLGDGASNGPVREDQRGGYEYWLAANAIEMTSDAYDCVVYNSDNQAIKLPGYRVDALADAAIGFINDRANGDAPFYLFLSFLEPHHQNHRDDHPAPDGYAERYVGRWTPPDLAALPGHNPPHLIGGNAQQSLAGYFGMVKRLDEALGRILDALRSLNLLDDTIVLYTCDHGSHFKTRNAEYKRSCHEASLRVPTALTGPGFVGGGRLPQLVSLVDLPPTLLDAAGLPGSACDGRAARSCRSCAAIPTRLPSGRTTCFFKSANRKSGAASAPTVGNTACPRRTKVATAIPARIITPKSSCTICNLIPTN